LAAELKQPLGWVLEQAITAYQPDRTEPEPTWRELIEARLKALELSKVEPAFVHPEKEPAIKTSGQGKRLSDNEFDALIKKEFDIRHGVIRNIPPALRKQGIAVSGKRMNEALKRLELK